MIEEEEDMYEIEISLDEIASYREAEIFFKSQDSYGLYKPAGMSIDSSRLKSGMFPKRLFVTMTDRVKVLRSQTKEANKQLKEALRSGSDDARSYLHRVVDLTLSEPRTEVLQDIQDTINVVVEEFMEDTDILKTISMISEKDYTTQIHLINVMVFSIGYAHYCGLPMHDIKLYALIGLLHDIGKVEIPDEILKAQRKLTQKEYEVIKKHPRHSWKMLQDCKFDKRVAQAALEHHERLDGSGYPRAKEGHQLSIYSRVLAIIDVYEALTTWRPYKDSISSPEALDLIYRDVANGKLDSLVFNQFAGSLDNLKL